MATSRPAIAAAFVSLIALGGGVASAGSSPPDSPSATAARSPYGKITNAEHTRLDRSLAKRGCNVILLVSLNTAGGSRDRAGGVTLRSVFTDTGERDPANRNPVIYRQNFVWKVNVPHRQFCAAVGWTYEPSRQFWRLKPATLSRKGGTYVDPARYIEISGHYPASDADTGISIGSMWVYYKRTSK